MPSSISDLGCGGIAAQDAERAARRLAYGRAYREKNREYLREYNRKKQAGYKARDPEGYKAKTKAAQRRWNVKNKEYVAQRNTNYLRKLRTTREYFARNRSAYMRKKSKAAKLGLPCTITAKDILYVWPADNCCPVFGVEFQIGRGRSPWNASVDRIIPSRGYVAGNICVISHRANTIKSDASLAELRAVVAWLENKNVE